MFEPLRRSVVVPPSESAARVGASQPVIEPDREGANGHLLGVKLNAAFSSAAEGRQRAAARS